MSRVRAFGFGLMLGLVLATVSEAREVVREDFETGPSSGREGKGWTQVGPHQPLSRYFPSVAARRGMISFDLERTAGADKARGAVLTLRNKANRMVFELSVVWSSEEDGQPAFILMTPPNHNFPGFLGPWSALVPLGRDVKPGQWLHVDLVWDDDTGICDVYVDGEKLPARRRVFDFAKRVFVTDMATTTGQAKRGETLSPIIPWPFSDVLSNTVSVRWGWEPFKDSSKRYQREAPPSRKDLALQNAVIDNFVLVTDEGFEQLHTAGHDVKSFKAELTKDGVLLTWTPPEIHGVDQQYFVYRRVGEGGAARFEKLTPTSVRNLQYLDTTALASQTYRYSVTSVYSDLKGGTLEGKYPPEATVTAAALAIDSVNTERSIYGSGHQIVVTLRGTPDLKATFSLGDLAKDVAMEEAADAVYVGRVAVPAGTNMAGVAVTGTLGKGSANVTKSGPPITIDTLSPEPVDKIIAGAAWSGENPLFWDPSKSADVAEYRVYRGEGRAPALVGRSFATVPAAAMPLGFVDTRVVPGLEYQYAVVAVDKASNAATPSPVVKLKAVAGDGPKLTNVAVDALGKTVRPGKAIGIAVTGESGAAVKVDMGAVVAGLSLTEEGRTGRYVGSYTVADKDVALTKGIHRVVAHLEDAFGASLLAGPEVAIVGQDGLDDKTPPVITKTNHDGWKAAGISGKLVPGDIVTVSLEGEPAGFASFELSEVAGRVGMTETSPGVYSGSFVVPQGAAGSAVPVTVYLADDAGNETAVVAEQTLAFDTRLRLTVAAKDKLLPADRTTQTTLTAKATDANGKPLQGRELALTLSTTEEYTGVVGGGAVGGQFASMDDVDNVEVRWGGKTDSFGEVSATYTAGFAAKTALLVAKDLVTGDVGAGWLNTYVASTVAIELTPATRKGAASRALLRMTADPTKLTADGRSTSRIKVWLTDLANAPLAGTKVSFALAGTNGTLRVLQGTTDTKGIATAEYRSGTAIGTVTITAASVDYGAASSVQIILMSDAPAKVDLVASAKSLIADNTSKATLSVRVSDIHDNPNDQVPVTFSLLQGAGTLSSPSLLTDRNGEGAVTFTAGRTAGTAIVEARHTSRAPTDDELRRIYGTMFVPRWYDRQERDRVTVMDWLVKPGDKVSKGASLVTLDTRTGTRTLVAPADGVFVREVKHERDQVSLGDTVGYVEIDPIVWKTDYVK